MQHKAVIGAGFGDEGKGLFTDFLCQKAERPLVIRFSGGQQAGHTVVYNGLRHVFSNFGSGTLQGVPSYFARFCTVDPVGVVNELEVLLEKGVEPLLYIDAECPVTTPYDVCYNQQHHPHGSCGVGFGATINREEQFYSLTFADLFYPWILETRLDLIKEFYKNYTDVDLVDLKDFLQCCAVLTRSPWIRMSRGIPPGQFSDYIYEGSQGLLLDQQYGFFPYVTRSDTGIKNVLSLSGNRIPEVYLITRAYQTRHGPGPMSNEHLLQNIKKNPFETNVCNSFQGEFRRSLLDLSLLQYALQRDPVIATAAEKYLVMTCLDHIENEYRFTQEGNIVCCDNEHDFITRIATELAELGIKKIYTSAADHADLVNSLVLKD
ncbi:MAG: adenylosuccinate synthetase [Candidatus Electrothrix sp. AW1]|nr:adenylosuccinate synthetase [Candidatus Electrothrix sp. AX1]MCI5183192.1 adenylosuccinate synthetase [Candidatus Electrothrix gigas]